MYVFRQVFLHILHSLVHGIGYLDVIGARLWNHYDAYHRHAVHLHIAFDVRRTEFGAAYVAEPDNTVAVLFQDEIIEFLCCMHQPECADSQFDGVSLDAARGEFHILIVYRILYVDGGNAVTGHLDRVEPQAHGITFFSPNAYTAHIGDCLQLLFYGEVGYFAEFQQRAFVALQSNHEDRHGVCIGFGYGWRVAVAWQVTLGARHFVTYIVGGCLQVYGKFEFYRNT